MGSITMTSKRQMPKRRNPVHKELIEDAKFRLKVHNPKKDVKAPPEPSVEEAIIEYEEEIKNAKSN